MMDRQALAIQASSGGVSDTPPLSLFTLALLGVILAAALCLHWMQGAQASMIAAVIIVVAGIPHGAFDLQTLGAPGGVSGGTNIPIARWRLLALYLGLLGSAAALWAVAPALALIIFLAMAAVHFGDDWHMVEPGLLRHMSGLSMIAVIAAVWPHDVTQLFAALTNTPFADALTRALMMIAPIAGLITLVALGLAIQRGHWPWALAYSLAVTVAVIAPPVIGFAVFFVGIHSAIHLRAARAILKSWPLARFVGQGVVISAVCLAIALMVVGAGLRIDAQLPVVVFKLLAVLTVPHLLLTHGWLPLRLVLGHRHSRATQI